MTSTAHPTQSLLRLVRSYSPQDADDSSIRRRCVNFIELQPQCLERSLSVGHVTGSAWLVNQTMDAVLLTHHRKLNIWVQLGGHADGDPDLCQVALREAQEESGISTLRVLSPTIFDLDIHLIPARGAEPAHEHFDVRFVLQTVGTDQFRCSAESKELRWVPIDDLHLLTSERSLLRMREKWYAFRRALG